ncbi:ER lumen protein retaining receptor [Pancytospora epiphaga]|nr:ER lumen protein retaining receptor [Pancytospora epiphaga]
MSLLLAGKIFRFAGDALMFSSRAILIKKIIETHSVSGLSLQTQLLYLLTYFLRYLDLFVGPHHTDPLNIYNKVMKIIFIAYQVYIVYLIAVKYSSTYNKRFDVFNLPVILLGAFLISFFVKGETFSFGSYIEEYLYTASLLIETVAILPQLVMIQEAGDCETLTSHYIFLLGLYRLCYAFSFIIRYLRGKGFDVLIVATSLIQTGLYVDFFVVYYSYVMKRVGFSKAARL